MATPSRFAPKDSPKNHTYYHQAYLEEPNRGSRHQEKPSAARNAECNFEKSTKYDYSECKTQEKPRARHVGSTDYAKPRKNDENDFNKAPKTEVESYGEPLQSRPHHTNKYFPDLSELTPESETRRLAGHSYVGKGSRHK